MREPDPPHRARRFPTAWTPAHASIHDARCTLYVQRIGARERLTLLTALGVERAQSLASLGWRAPQPARLVLAGLLLTVLLLGGVFAL